MLLGLALCFLANAQKRALLVIDVQFDFLPNGSLAVPGGEEVIPIINEIRAKNTFDLVVFTQDWHTPSHVSFASTHGMPVFSTIELAYRVNGSLCRSGNVSYGCAPEDIHTQLNQTLWPNHCVQHSGGAELHPSLWRAANDPIIQKGYREQIDSYSAFWDNGHVASTSLDALLQAQGISEIFVTGLALDYCVFFTAMDGPPTYTTSVIQDASRGINAATIKDALDQLAAKGVTVLNASAIPPQSCSVIEELPGCAVSVADLNTTQVDSLFTQLCDRFDKSYVTPEWCANVLQGRFGECSAQQRLNYALSVWKSFASECCTSLKDSTSCSSPPTGSAPSPSPAPEVPPSGMSNLLVVGLVAAALLVVLGVACFLQAAHTKRKDKEMGTPLVEQGFSAL